MKLTRIFFTALILIAFGGAISAQGQSTVYVQSRSGGTSGGANNPDFVCTKFSSTASSIKSTAPGLPGGSTSSRFVATPTNSTAFFTVSPNNTTAGQLVNGTTYAVAITFNTSSAGQTESSDIVVTTSDTQTTGNDTFAGTTTAFKSGNGANTWVTIGNVTINGPTPTFIFTWQSGTNVNRWYADTVRFTPLAPGPTAQYWDTGSVGGTGPWDTTSLNWNTLADGTGTQGVYTQADTAVFGGASGTVSIDPINGITTDGGLEFDTTGYVIQSGPLTLGSGTNIAIVGSGNTATISSVITGVNGMATTGLGTLVLASTNNLIGTVSPMAGTLSLGTNETFTSLGGIPAGTLALGTNTLTVGDVTSTSSGSVIADAGASTPGFLVKQGSGVLTLTGSSTFHGKTTVTGGAIAIGADAALGTAPSAPTAGQITLSNGGRLDFTAAITLNTNRGITLGAGGGMISTGGSGTAVTIPGGFSGPGSLTIPTGSFDFTGSSSYSGGTFITLATVDATGNGLASIRFDSSNAIGSGPLFVSPVNGHNVTLRTFTATNVLVTNAIELDAFAGAGYFLAGATASSKICTITFSGPISGTGPVSVGLSAALGSNPGGTVVLSGNNTNWSGAVVLQVGNLGVGSPTALGTAGFSLVPIAGSNIVLFATTPLTGANALTNPVAINSANGPLGFGGTNNLELAGPVALFGSSTISNINTGASILSGGIADSVPSSGFSLNSAGPNPLTLSGASTYDGGTTVSGGTLIVNNTAGSGTGSGAVTVNSGATLAGSGTISGTVAVNGTIAPGTNAPGTLSTADETWNSGGSYTWNINKEAGTVGGNPGSSLLNITGALTLTGPFTLNVTSLTLANAPGAVSDFNNSASHTWTIAHTTGGTTGFTPGAVTVNTAGFANSLGSGTFSVTTNATDVLLNFTVSAPPSISSISVNTGANTLSISGTNGPANAGFRVLSATNVTQQLTNWVQVGTGTFDSGGGFNFGGTFNPAEAARFFIIVTP